MKRKLLLCFLGFFIVNMAQSQDKILFTYDTAGNQIQRELCISCPSTTGKQFVSKEIEDLEEEDLQKISPEDVISYYPNPVKEELYVKWDLFNEKTVASIYLYDMNGRALQVYNNLEKKNAVNIPFYNYPRGNYLVVLMYNGGEQKTIKIVK